MYVLIVTLSTTVLGATIGAWITAVLARRHDIQRSAGSVWIACNEVSGLLENPEFKPNMSAIHTKSVPILRDSVSNFLPLVPRKPDRERLQRAWICCQNLSSDVLSRLPFTAYADAVGKNAFGIPSANSVESIKAPLAEIAHIASKYA